MNVLQYLIDNARLDAQSARNNAPYAIAPAEDYRKAKELDAMADLAEHSLRALGLIASPAQKDDGA